LSLTEITAIGTLYWTISLLSPKALIINKEDVPNFLFVWFVVKLFFINEA
jgi:hypothetical protein